MRVRRKLRYQHKETGKTGLGREQENGMLQIRYDNGDVVCDHVDNFFVSMRLKRLATANLRRRCLKGADFYGVDFFNADLSRADLSGANLGKTDLRLADLTETDLRGADLRGADLRWADLTGADLTNADFRGADVTGVKGL
jgi:uncharacterized protein YjbI with pentapeptide repeats